MFRLILFLLFFIFLHSCGQNEPGQHGINDKEKAAAEKEIRMMLADYFEAIKANGLTAEFAYLDSTASFYWVPPGYRSRLNFDSVASILRSRAAGFQEINFQWEELYVDVMSRRIANYSGKVKGVMVDTAGQRSDVHLIETGVIVKKGNEWKLLCGQSNVLE